MALPADDAELLARVQPGGPEPGARGLFRDDGWLRRISGEPVAILGGGRALVLEVAHPFVAAAVAEHSAFRADPFGRLQRTLAAMQTITFAELPAALEAARAVERAHAHVRGRLPEPAGRFPAGTPYSGRDTEAIRWVWATLADTAWLLYERFVAPLGAAECEAYYAEHRVLARLLGVPSALVPRDWGAFRCYFDAMVEGDLLAVTALAREIATTALHAPGGAGAARRVRSLTAGLLPPRLRQAFGLPWDEVRQQRFDALISEVRALRVGPPRARSACSDPGDRAPSSADPSQEP